VPLKALMIDASAINRALLSFVAVLPWTFNLSAADGAAIDFKRDIAPILVQKCVTCHNPEKSKGGYQLHTFEALLKPGESKEPSLVPGMAKESKLFQLITAKDAEDRMPQKDDPLPASQVTLIEQWINKGAEFDGPSRTMPLAALIAPTDHPAPPPVYPRPVPILALAFSPDGSELAAGGYHEVTLWNPANGTLLRRLTNAPQRIHALAFNPGGTLLAVGGGSPGILGEARLIDTASGRARRILATTRDVVLAVSFSPDGNQIAVGGADNTIRLFDVASGKQKWMAELHADWVMALAFSPDGKRLGSASRDKTVRLIDATQGELDFTYTGHNEPVFAVTFSPDGTNVCTAGRDKEIHIWRGSDGKKTNEIGGFDGEIYRVLWQEDEIISCSADAKVRIHRAKGKKPRLERTLSGHADCVYAVAIDAKGKRIASGGYDGEVRIWDGVAGTLQQIFIAAPGVKGTATARAD
jgi:dipeptidyl aminopeptidase/acylaminoacyl peptidase